MYRLEEWVAQNYVRAHVFMATRQTDSARKEDGPVVSGSEDGMSTAEYAVGTLAAAAIAGTLLAIAKSGPFKTMILNLFKQAFTV